MKPFSKGDKSGRIPSADQQASMPKQNSMRIRGELNGPNLASHSNLDFKSSAFAIVTLNLWSLYKTQLQDTAIVLFSPSSFFPMAKFSESSIWHELVNELSTTRVFYRGENTVTQVMSCVYEWNGLHPYILTTSMHI